MEKVNITEKIEQLKAERDALYAYFPADDMSLTAQLARKEIRAKIKVLRDLRSELRGDVLTSSSFVL